MMKWRYDPSRARLTASHPELDLGSLRSVFRRFLISRTVNEIVYETPTVVMILRGRHLRRWMAGATDTGSPKNARCLP